MKALHIPNYYRYRGGEDVMVERICNLLGARGHSVSTYERRSADIHGTAAKLKAFASSAYCPRGKREVSAIIADIQPDVVHLHNQYPLISRSGLETCAEVGVPAIMRRPNYRLECPPTC